MKSWLLISCNSVKSIWIDKGMVVTDLVLATLVPFLIQAIIWKYIYSQGAPSATDFSYQQMLFYYAYAILFGRFNNSYDLIMNHSYAIQEGTLELSTLKPMSMGQLELLKFVGGGAVYILPILLALGLNGIFSLSQISGNFNWSFIPYYLGVGLQIFLSQILCFYLGWTIAQLCFWFVRSDFLANLTATASAFLGGELLPPSLWPDFLKPLIQYNPFSLLVSRPAELLIHQRFDLLSETLALNVFYILFFICLSHLLFQSGMRRYHSVGG
jgi:ABC-2 type transport system permease protein